MRKKLAMFLVLALVAPPVWADITGVTVQTPLVWLGDPATVTVQGNGPCAVRIRWEQGDTESFPPMDLTLSPPYANTYQDAGVYNIVVNDDDDLGCDPPPDDPPTSAPEPVTVLNPLEGLCLVADCGVDPNAGPIPTITSVPPVITSVLGAIGEPGKVLLIGGLYFQAVQGKVHLQNGNGQTTEMDVLEWHPGGIGIEVPTDIAQFCTPPFSLKVENAFGGMSNLWPIGHFTGPAEVMPMSDVQVLTCGDDGNFNHCNDVDPGGDWCAFGSWFLGSPDHNTSVFAFHGNCPAAIGADTGIDEYRATVQKTGWTLSHALFDSEGLDTFDIIFTGLGIQPQPGAGEFEFEVGWLADSAVNYGVDIVVEGPACSTYN